MKGNDPILPPGIKFDGARRGRSNMRMAVVVVVMLHMALFAGILFNACKQKDEGEGEGGEEKQSLAEEMRQIVGQPTPNPSEPEGMPPLPGTSNPGPIASAPAPLPPAPAPVAPITLPPDSAGGGGLTPTPAPVGFGPPTSPLVPTGANTQHTVASGENFWTIARQYGVTAKSIEQANPAVVPTKMKIGQKINIPAKTSPAAPAAAPAPAVNDPNTYTVKSGDTLGHIAMRNNVKVKDLRAINGLNSDLIRIGQKLKLPISSALPTPPLPLPTVPAPGASSGAPLPRIELDPATGLPVSSPSSGL